MFTFKKLKAKFSKYLLSSKEFTFVKGGRGNLLYKGKSHGYPPPFDEE